MSESSLPPKLYIVGTPIGNMGDMSQRAQDVLSSVDVILCEDTRQTAKLCARFNIKRPLVRCDENVIESMVPQIVSRLKGGESFAYVSDAGMPCISDPGQRVVDAVLDKGLSTEVVPGPSALTAALAASGLDSSAFLFDGFLPRKTKARQMRIRQLLEAKVTLIFYESPKRLVASLKDIAHVAPSARVCVARELTKIHEELLRGSADELIVLLSQREEIKGECVIVLEPGTQSNEDAFDEDSFESTVAQALAQGESKSALARRLSSQFPLSRSELYAKILELSKSNYSAD